MKGTYLVDYNTVQSNGLDGIFDLIKSDKVIIFTRGVTPVRLPLIDRKSSLICHTEIDACNPRIKNSLSLQLSTKLGFELYNRAPNEFFAIVSNDEKFDFIINYWKSNIEHVALFRTRNIATAHQLGMQEVKALTSKVRHTDIHQITQTSTKNSDLLQISTKNLDLFQTPTKNSDLFQTPTKNANTH